MRSFLAPLFLAPPSLALLLRALPITALVLAAGTAAAQGQPAAVQGHPDIARIERYLNGLGTLQARFRQVAEDGGEAIGTFKLARPGRLRIDYDRPSGDFIVADGWFIYHWDDRMKNQSQTSIGGSLADFILRDDIRFSGDVTVTRLASGTGRVEVSLVQTAEPGSGELTLVFEDNPLRLRQWRVLDAQGLTTTVTLSDIQTDVSFDRRDFVFREPDGARRDR